MLLLADLETDEPGHGDTGFVEQCLDRLLAVRDRGLLEQHDILADYAARLLKDVKPGKKLKVAWDTGNGAVSGMPDSSCGAAPGESGSQRRASSTKGAALFTADAADSVASVG